jgi:hypothetical protein
LKIHPPKNVCILRLEGEEESVEAGTDSRKDLLDVRHAGNPGLVSFDLGLSDRCPLSVMVGDGGLEHARQPAAEGVGIADVESAT